MNPDSKNPLILADENDSFFNEESAKGGTSLEFFKLTPNKKDHLKSLEKDFWK
jgi:hypothetical protein